MKKLLIVLFLAAAFGLYAGDPEAPAAQPVPFAPFAIRVSSALAVPLGQNAEYFSTGAGAGVSLDYNLPASRAIFLRASLGYEYAPAKIGETFSVLSAGVGAGVNLLSRPRLTLPVSVSGGYYYGLLNGPGEAEGYGLPYLAADTGVCFFVSPKLRLDVGAEYKWLVGFQGLLRPFAAAALRFGGESSGRISPDGRLPTRLQPLQAEAIQFEETRFERVFPVFFSYYSTHPVGSVVLRNAADVSLTDLKVGLLVSTYMDAPTESRPVPELKSGQSVTLDLNALFNDSILTITEGKKVAVTLTADYRLRGVAQQKKLNTSLEILYRNAMSWDDDRRAAVFVTAKDPAVRSFATNVRSMVQGKGGSALDPNLQMGIAIHGALTLHRLTYTPDPKSPFSEKKAATEDFLQFPRETLGYRGGDCDDLSILYCALLESLGVETAFVTVPGHIYMALALELPPEQAREAFSKPDDLVFRQGKAWLPLEVTERQGGFLLAWLTGAKEWRESHSRQQANLYPIREAWQVYPPVQLPAQAEGQVAWTLPPADQVVAAYQEAVAKHVGRELEPRVAQLQGEIRNSQGSAKAINRLGILYARYEQWDKAEKEFQRILGREEYLPAVLNLGNLWFLRGNAEKALGYYERAFRLDPNNAGTLLGMARANHEIENYGQVAKLYRQLNDLNPGLAAQYAYLGLRGEEATRAAEVGRVKGTVKWEE